MTTQFLDDLRELNQLRQQEWPGSKNLQGTSAKMFRALELGGEVGEAMNNVKKLVREDLGIQGSRIFKEDLAEELADIVICVDLLAEEYGIDLIEAISDKFNKTSIEQGLTTKFTKTY